VLTSEKYIGNNVYSRTSCKLKKKHVNNPPSEWVRANGVFAGIIEPELFLKAQEIILARSRKYTDEEMLEHLRAVLKHGRISGILIDAAEGLPSSTAFSHRFGTLRKTSPGLASSRISAKRPLTPKYRHSSSRSHCGLIGPMKCLLGSRRKRN
jgi:hypothetical protein